MVENYKLQINNCPGKTRMLQQSIWSCEQQLHLHFALSQNMKTYNFIHIFPLNSINRNCYKMFNIRIVRGDEKRKMLRPLRYYHNLCIMNGITIKRYQMSACILASDSNLIYIRASMFYKSILYNWLKYLLFLRICFTFTDTMFWMRLEWVEWR